MTKPLIFHCGYAGYDGYPGYTPAGGGILPGAGRGCIPAGGAVGMAPAGGYPTTIGL